ncbi:hypothetical protein DL762_006967 [Monosporascus cannonballus]|uniref:Uncharacterized protein n=1 Tax=Monosporascus cannonballus TaxID=155416 RepID=A0ABY0H0I7_9PEZI|nr:hypothetical protein DL762_006967 [Monosporascus cannonballus]RYP00883.1 hypothetical protein DL763_000513 [Monosporascus cannonballus]
MAVPPTATVPANSHSAFQSVPPTPAPAVSSSGLPTATSGQLRIAASQAENVALAQQLANHQQYLCYQLPHYYQCGHRVGSTSLLVGRKHINMLGYGTPCDADCAVDYSRRVIDPKRCPWCEPLEECLAVTMKHSCGHLAGVLALGGQTHNRRLGLQTSCDAWCCILQVDQDVGGACKACTWGHCCMVWEKCQCGHRGGIIAHHVVGPHHILELGSSLVPCVARCKFRHKEREVGRMCPRCRPMHMQENRLDRPAW